MKRIPVTAWLTLSIAALLCVSASGAKDTLKIKYPAKVTDCQGVCSLQPRLQERWTPLDTGMLLDKGDWIRTDPRGANALQIRLAGQDILVAGPGSLIELVDENNVSIVRGEVEVRPAGKKLSLLLPGKVRKQITANTILRVTEDAFAELQNVPNWLKYFKGTETHESMGALVAKVDGRDTPLTLGYHKVTVDIRDQIARTVIEESFVNHTDSRLEGIFYFPLPQDASISGFGMWIGDELVEADVVEKQRAREIYETILREKRDPGLLEWTGGNIFKARVFPIFAHSEKRIKITYTQVLPMNGGRCRYSYALQSEMLKQNPLKELALKVFVNSALPVKSVTCPSHNARLAQTEHSGEVEFSAQEYTPTRDFEVEIETDNRNNEALLIPHRRGDDGYFLLLVNPVESDRRERPLIGDGNPLDLIIVADTSASMDAEQRKQQDQFIAFLLGSLGGKDRFRLAAMDVKPVWFEAGISNSAPAEGIAPTGDAVARARAFIANRVSLGWTDLGKAAQDVFKQAGKNTHIIFVGDCVDTSGDADPVEAAKNLKRLYDAAGARGTVHAIATGSSFEPVILKALGSLGGGSYRKLEGEKPARTGAMNLLEELTRPGMRNMKVEFKGLRVARVYPEELPNLPAGCQQIILGRYLPEGKDQRGTAIVTGEYGGKTVRYEKAVSLKDAESGNAFIPRLWARMHLDSLLAQGQTPAVKADVIALSEEYYIMTPYTSFLVLESDADRERFGVTRRFKMRDGEQFFAAGRDSATFELRRKQMALAGEWRQDLRRRMLRELLVLGRVLPPAPEQDYYRVDRIGSLSGSIIHGLKAGAASGGAYNYRSRHLRGGNELGVDFDYNGLANGPMGEGEDKRALNMSEKGDFGDEDMDGYFDGKEAQDAAPAEPATEEPMAAPAMPPSSVVMDISTETVQQQYKKPTHAELPASARMEMGKLYGRRSGGGPRNGYFSRIISRPKKPGWYGNWANWLNRVFPYLQPPSPVPAPTPTTAPKWSVKAHDLSESLLRLDKLNAMTGGLKIKLAQSAFNPRDKRVTSRSVHEYLYSTNAWFQMQELDGGQTLVQWYDGKQRGVLAPCFQAGRVRDAVATDAAFNMSGCNDFSINSIERSYGACIPEITKQGGEKVLLTIRYPTNPGYEQRFLIDTRRKVLLESETRNQGRMQWRTTFSDFVEVAGCWWAIKIVSVDADGKQTSSTSIAISLLDMDAFAKQLAAAMQPKAKALLLREPLPGPAAADQAQKDNKMTFEHHVTLISMHMATQQPEKATEDWKSAKKLIEGRAAADWLDIQAFLMTRRNEEAKLLVGKKAQALASGAVADDLFLGNWLYQEMCRCAQANEVLVLLEKLKPVFSRQPEHLAALKTWAMNRANYLQNAGRTEETLKIYEGLAAEDLYDINVQTTYFNALMNHNDIEKAAAWITALLKKNDLWNKSERDAVRNNIAWQLMNRMSADKWIGFFEEWIAEDTTSQTAYQYYLTGLLRLNKMDETRKFISKWIEAGIKEAEDLSGKEQNPPDERRQAIMARLQAAVQVALGQNGWNNNDYLDPYWNAPLAKTAKAVFRSKTYWQIASQIMQNGYFQQTEEIRALRRYFSDALDREAGTLEPNLLASVIAWVSGPEPKVDKEIWNHVAVQIEERWTKEKESDAHNQLGSALLTVFNITGRQDDELRFLRRQMTEGPKEYHQGYVAALFNALLQRNWSKEYEEELFRLLPALVTTGDGKTDSSIAARQFRTDQLVPPLYTLVDRMIDARVKNLSASPEAKSKMTRQELAAESARVRAAAKEVMVERLMKEREKQEALLRPWLTIERLYLETQLNKNATNIAAECWEFMPPKPWLAETALQAESVPPPETEIEDDSEEESVSEKQLEKADSESLIGADLILFDRCLTTLSCLAARRSADPALVKRLSKYMDLGIQLEAEARTKNADGKDAKVEIGGYWQYNKYRLLVAKDEPQELEEALNKWIAPEKADPTWRLALGYLMAEQNRIPEAIAHFEALEKADALGPKEYRSLADWHMVMNQPGKREETLIKALGTTPEHQLGNRLYQYLSPWQRNDSQVPTELDPEVIQIFKALFRKSQWPHNYVGQLSEFYRHSRDFRLLQCLSEGMPGHTAEQVYPFVRNLDGVLREIRDESTADLVAKSLSETRKRAATVIDNRALDILELQVERRAAELFNQPGPHAQAALAAMKRSFDREWAKGERRLMADLLAGLGKITSAELGREQLRQLRELYACRTDPIEDRLAIAASYAQTLWAYDKQDEAINALEAALNDYRASSGWPLQSTANNVFNQFIGYLEARSRFDLGELQLLAELKRPANEQQEYWLNRRLMQLYVRTLSAKGSVSLGTGETLYRALYAKMVKELEKGDRNYRSQMVSSICSLFRTAKVVGIEPVDLRAFAFEVFPVPLEKEPDQNNYHNWVSEVANTLHNLLGPLTALEFLVERLEKEPESLRLAQYNSGWQQHAYRLGEWRTEAKPTGGLEARLLALVLKELRRDLTQRRELNRIIYNRHNSYFWQEKAGDFKAAAEDVWRENRTSGPAVLHIAQYLWYGLDERNRATEMLLDAHGNGRLNESGQAVLVNYLHYLERYLESVPILLGLIRAQPDQVGYRTQLMTAYFKTNNDKALRKTLADADKHFHEGNLWQEGNLAPLAYACLQTQLHPEAVKYFDELIPLHKRNYPRQTADGTLSSYYGQLAEAHIALGHTVEAVDAASGAIVAWGGNQNNRQNAINSLKNVLSAAKDLAAYAAYLDKQSAESGAENPIVRKAIGQVYLDRRNFKEAIRQLELAIEVQPNDRETHVMLIQAYEMAGDKEGVIKRLLASVELSRRDINLYRDLADRYKGVGNTEQSERAYLSIVEMQPNESESHAMLAAIRERQGRWDEAIHHWRQVIRVRTTEPTGYQKLAEAQIHRQQWKDALETVNILIKRDWPARFGNVQDETQDMLNRIPEEFRKNVRIR